MTRVLPLLVLAALVVALFLAPAPSTGRLAAVDAGSLLLEPVGGEPADASQPLWPAGAEPLPPEVEGPLSDPDGGLAGTLLERILRSTAVRPLPPETVGGRPRLEYLHGGANLQMMAEVEDEPTYDPIWPEYVRQSVLRELRSKCEEWGVDLVVQGLKTSVPGGVNVGVRVSPIEHVLTLEARVGSSPALEVARTWRPVDQLSLLPPLVAIFLAILIRRPVIALFAGLWSGVVLVEFLRGTGTVAALWQGLRNSITGAPPEWNGYILGQIRDQGRLQIVLFVIFMLAMVGVITRGGGIRGIMERLSALARDARRTQVTAWIMGLVIFFDDYANTILVGSTMRPLADRFRVAREKLAYIVDSTAAPVAGISVLSTWIAFEVSTFAPFLPDAELAASQGYAVFLQTLPFRFYCLLTIFFVGAVVLSGRDFGPMLTAERRARGGQLLRPGATPMVGEAVTRLEAAPGVRVAASTALVPLFLFVGTVLGWILVKGGAFDMGARVLTVAGISQVLKDGSGNEPLMYGAIVGFTAALLLSLRAGLRLSLAVQASFDALRSMGVALAILYLAWSLGKVCEDLGTATFLAVSLGDTLPWMILPGVLFLLSGMIAFSTGSSWSTMTILLPLVIGLAYRLGFDSVDASVGLDGQRAAGLALLVVSIGAVLEGAIFGDHCSPISDTTVMSSIASASDHIDHVRTQMPYAMLTMVVALVCCYFPATFLRWNPFVCLGLGAAALLTVLFVYGRRADDPPKAVQGSGAA